jgi:hypothetical protein
MKRRRTAGRGLSPQHLEKERSLGELACDDDVPAKETRKRKKSQRRGNGGHGQRANELAWHGDDGESIIVLTSN